MVGVAMRTGDNGGGCDGDGSCGNYMQVVVREVMIVVTRGWMVVSRRYAGLTPRRSRDTNLIRDT